MSVEELQQRIAELEKENEKLKKWRQTAICTYEVNCCSGCEEFEEFTGFCDLCKAEFCEKCWEGHHVSLQVITDDTEVHLRDLCNGCTTPECGTCGSTGVRFVCASIRCSGAFCSRECWKEHLVFGETSE